MKQQPLVKTIPKKVAITAWSFRDAIGSEVNTTTSSYVSWTDSQNGYLNFDWLDTIAVKQNASSAYTSTIRHFKRHSPRHLSGLGLTYTAGKYVPYNACNYYTGAPDFLVPTYLDNNARNVALSKFYRKLADSYQQFDGLTFLGELTRTRRMILERAADLSNEIRKAAQNALRVSTRVRGSRRKRKVYSGAYLEAVFGWLPLFSDIENFGKAFDYEAQPVITIRSSRHSEGNPSTSTSSGGSFNVLAWTDIKNVIQTVDYHFVAGISPDWQKPDSFGLSVENVPLALWELTPWSFVVDYFIDIQGWLQSTIYSSIVPIYCVESIKKERIVTVRGMDNVEQLAAWHASNFSLSQGGQHLNTTSRYITFTRSVLSSLPQMKGPALRGIPSARKLLNLAALYSQRSSYSNL